MSTTISYQHLHILGKRLHVQSLIHPNNSPKPTLVFLHEGLGCIPLWKDFPLLLAEQTGLNAIVYERQGYGKSDMLDLPRPDDYLETEARLFLPELLQQLNIKNPILVGHSDGGTIALIYAALYPTHSLITMAAHVLVEAVTLVGINEATRHYTSKTTQKLAKYHGEKADALYWAWADTWRRDSYKSWNIEHFLKDIDCPTLTLQGKQDEFATDAHAINIAKNIGSNASCVLIDNCAHMPHIQAKENSLELIRKFITANKGYYEYIRIAK